MPVSSPYLARHMSPQSPFQILRIRSTLRLNGSFDEIEAIFCKCSACNHVARVSKAQGLAQAPDVIVLTCPDCGATADVQVPELRERWAEQVRRDRLLWGAGIYPDELYGP